MKILSLPQFNCDKLRNIFWILGQPLQSNLDIYMVKGQQRNLDGTLKNIFITKEGNTGRTEEKNYMRI